MNATQIKILEAAEVELAECGFAGASIRNITQRAGVNVASVNYHFGSKEELIKELFRYRITPLNELRIALLKKAQEDSADGVVPVSALVNILIRPAVERMMSKEGQRFVQGIARCMSEPLEFMEDLDEEIFSEIFALFCQALQKARPQLDELTVVTHLSFTVCSLVGFMMQFHRMHRFHKHVHLEQDFQVILDQYIRFIASGIKGARVPVS